MSMAQIHLVKSPPSHYYKCTHLTQLLRGLVPINTIKISKNKRIQMEKFNGGLKSYWKRRAYSRIDGGSGHRRPRSIKIKLGGGASSRRRWQIRVPKKLKTIRFRFNPKRFFVKIRDAYVRMMLGFADMGAISGGFGYVGKEIDGFGVGNRKMKEYDEKMLVQIYRNLLTQRPELVAAVDGGVAAVSTRAAPMTVV